MTTPGLSPDDVSQLIDHILKSKDPASVGLRKILKHKKDVAEDFPLHPLEYEEFHAEGRTRGALSEEEKRIVKLENQVKYLLAQVQDQRVKRKTAVAAEREKAFAEGYAKGEAEGLATAQKGYDDRITQIQERVASILDSLEKSKNEIYENAHSMLLRVCLELVKKIIHTEPSINPDIVLSVIKKSLSYIADKEKLVIRVSKDDFENVSSKKDFWLPVAERVASIEIEQDERIEKGGCIIESNSGVADGRLGVQLEELGELVDKIWQGISLDVKGGQGEK
jgi:flagellar assembly protein FliH